jgi:hypothetical protein
VNWIWITWISCASIGHCYRFSFCHGFGFASCRGHGFGSCCGYASYGPRNGLGFGGVGYASGIVFPGTSGWEFGYG